MDIRPKYFNYNDDNEFYQKQIIYEFLEYENYKSTIIHENPDFGEQLLEDNLKSTFPR